MPKPLADLSYKNIHLAIDAAEQDLAQAETVDPKLIERIRAAKRNLMIARLVLECDQSLSPLDYDEKPCDQMANLRGVLDGTREQKPPKHV